MRTSTLIGTLAVLLTANSAGAIPGLSCDQQPRTDCEVAESAAFKISRKYPFSGKDKLMWKWKGSGDIDDFGAPTISNHLQLCLYDGLALKASFQVDPSNKWSSSTTGFKFIDKEGDESGITKILLSAKGGKAKVTLKGGGNNLTLPYPGIDTQHPTVQLNNSDNILDCWTATGTLPPVKNTDSVAVDKCGSTANPCTQP